MAAASYMNRAVGDYQRAAHQVEEAVRHYRQQPDRSTLAVALYVAAQVEYDLARYDQATAYLGESLEIFRAEGDRLFAAHVLNTLGLVIYHGQPDVERAEALVLESLGEFRALANSYGAGIALTNLGRVARDRGDVPRAAACYVESLILHWEEGHQIRIAVCLRGLAIVAAFGGEPDQAARCSARGGSPGRGHGAPRAAAEPAVRPGGRRRAGASLGDAAFAAALGGGPGAAAGRGGAGRDVAADVDREPRERTRRRRRSSSGSPPASWRSCVWSSRGAPTPRSPTPSSSPRAPPKPTSEHPDQTQGPHADRAGRLRGPARAPLKGRGRCAMA